MPAALLIQSSRTFVVKLKPKKVEQVDAGNRLRRCLILSVLLDNVQSRDESVCSPVPKLEKQIEVFDCAMHCGGVAEIDLIL